MGSACRDIHRRQGFTLLEMIILVALVALVAGLSWPSLSKLARKRELLESARQVRVALLRTRLEAIESGVPHQFRYQYGTGAFESSLFSQDEDLPSDATLPSDASLPGGLGGEFETELAGGDAGSAQPRLPDGILFVDPDSRAEEDIELLTDEADVDDAPWSPPILFYPNGRTFNARLQLTNGRYVVDVTLRGLTGTARVGKVLPVAEPAEEAMGGIQ